MHKILITVICLSLVGLLSCSSQSGGSSDAPGTDIAGSWNGAMIAFDEEGNEISTDQFELTFRYFGTDLSDGSISNPVVFGCIAPECNFRTKSCPEPRPTLAGSQRGDDIVANVLGVRGDFIKWNLEVVGTDRIEGTYEYRSDSNEECADTTGVVTMDRS
jgi:hypothetical protein